MKIKNSQSRRTFLKKTVLATSLLPFINENIHAFSANHESAAGLKVHIFSKHLQFLDYSAMADAAAEIGFDGVDLTVRPKGHVLPERVETDLPKAVEAIRKTGKSPLMMTTAVQAADNPVDKKLLETAAKLGIQYYRMNWLQYPADRSIPDAIQQFQKTLKDLGQLNKDLDLKGCYQNHSGNLAGASIWELYDILEKADPQHTGVQYDIRHAVVEGGLSWKNGLRLIQPRIKMLAVKDFIWAKKDGGWVVQDVPIGEGMVDFKTYFKLLKQYKIQVPVSLHLEYPLGGAEHGNTQITIDKKEVFAAMKSELGKVRRLWEEA